MTPKKNDFYLMWGDYYVAWPLSVPNQYADWMLVTFEQNNRSASVDLVPVRVPLDHLVSHKHVIVIVRCDFKLMLH